MSRLFQLTINPNYQSDFLTGLEALGFSTRYFLFFASLSACSRLILVRSYLSAIAFGLLMITTVGVIVQSYFSATSLGSCGFCFAMILHFWVWFDFYLRIQGHIPFIEVGLPIVGDRGSH